MTPLAKYTILILKISFLTALKSTIWLVMDWIQEIMFLIRIFFFHFEFRYYIDVVVFPWRRIFILKNYILSPLKMKVLVTRSYLTVCNPMDCSPPGSSIHGISQAKKIGVGCHCLLQGIFLTQWSGTINSTLLSLHLSPSQYFPSLPYQFHLYSFQLTKTLQLS